MMLFFLCFYPHHFDAISGCSEEVKEKKNTKYVLKVTNSGSDFYNMHCKSGPQKKGTSTRNSSKQTNNYFMRKLSSRRIKT
jgi:hypothetical protein